MTQYPQDDFMFVSLYTRNREPFLKSKESKRLLLAKLMETKKQFRIVIAAYVLLDDHMHLLFSSPPGSECSAIVNHLRAGMQKEWRKDVQSQDDAQIWEHGFKMSVVRGKNELRNHMDFIHYDAVRHGLVERAGDYRWSSLPARVAEGHYPDDWSVLAPPAGVARVLRPMAAIQ
jgi:putative transposase